MWLDDWAVKRLPAWLARHTDVQVEGRLVRRYVRVAGQDHLIPIFGHGRRDGERVLLLGAVKSEPSRADVDRFFRLARAIAEEAGLPAVLLFVAHSFHPSVERYLQERGILGVWSYELDE